MGGRVTDDFPNSAIKRGGVKDREGGQEIQRIGEVARERKKVSRERRNVRERESFSVGRVS